MASVDLKLDWRGASRRRIGAPLGIGPSEVRALHARVAAAHAEIADGRRLSAAGERTRAGQPLDYGFMRLPAAWLGSERGELDQLIEAADRLAERSNIFAVLGIGGSYLGARALFEALCHPHHNELPLHLRQYRPRLHFEGNSFDGEAMHALLDLLETDDGGRFAVNVISKSGQTLETEVAYHILRRWLRARYGEHFARAIVATTDDDKGVLRALSDLDGCDSFDVPDDVGGRYSVFSAVGLLPARVVGIDIVRLLQGARDFQAHCDAHPSLDGNPAYEYAVLMHLAEQKGVHVRVLCVWAKRLEALGLWYDQLYAESLGKDGKSSTPVTAVCTRELHSRQQQHQDGPNDKIFSNLWVRSPDRSLRIGKLEGDAVGSERAGGKAYCDLARAAREAVNASFNADGRPTLELIVPRLDAYVIGQLMQFFMNATVMEGLLMGVWPFGQPSVEKYKLLMNERLPRMRASRAEDREPRF